MTAEVTHCISIHFDIQVANVDFKIMSRLEEPIKLSEVRLKSLSGNLGVEAYVDTSESSS